MNNIFLIMLVIMNSIVLGGLVWQFLKHKKLRQDHAVLRDYVERINKDIAGLCSAALSVDNKLSDNHEQLKGIIEKVADFEYQEQQTSQPYHSAIQKVRNGAGAEELIQQCGVSREEAVLLIRLHGKG